MEMYGLYAAGVRRMLDPRERTPQLQDPQHTSDRHPHRHRARYYGIPTSEKNRRDGRERQFARSRERVQANNLFLTFSPNLLNYFFHSVHITALYFQKNVQIHPH